MAKPTRMATREGNRAKLVAAARAEFTERGYRETKIDAIAARAGLTRGAVYSNFPSKRALYFTVLAEDVELPADEQATSRTPEAALGALARAWVSKLPLATAPTHLTAHLLAEIAADERTRRPYAQLVKLSALQLGFALARLSRDGRPRVRQAEAALTLLEGARQLAAAAPGLVEPFHVVQACESLPEFDTGWDFPPELPPSRVLDAAWTPPEATDIVTGAPVDLTADGVVAVLGVHRVSGIEPAMRETAGQVTLVVVSSDPAEVFGLVRLTVAETRAALRAAFPPASHPTLRIVLDETGAIAAAAGVEGITDSTEVAVRIDGGRLALRAEGLAACAAAALDEPRPRR